MLTDPANQMRDFIAVAERLSHGNEDQMKNDILVEGAGGVMADNASAFTVLEDLREVVFRLRAFTESEVSPQALGIELGMQRAADMIENLLRRYEEGV